ncbi:hypothetical protein G6F22_021323 [Rhizopus arrhizus]|nr:hypothetical protein G6F22_021323 [Rhizopus arrhizus]
MQHEIARLVVRILVQVVDARGVEQRSAPLDAVDLIALGQQELRQVGPVLAGNAGNQCPFWHGCILKT